MSIDTVRHYLLTPLEAELVACFKLLSEPAQSAILTVVAAQTRPERQKLDTVVKLSLVKS